MVSELSERERIIRTRYRRWRRDQWRRCLEDENHDWRDWLDKHYCETVDEPRYDRKGRFQAFDKHDCLYVYGKDDSTYRRHMAIQRHWLHQTPERQLELEQLFAEVEQ